MSSDTGELYVVATPIGNLDDLSRRAVLVLQQVDLILAEDTRHSARLLQHYGIKKPVLAFHDHNERSSLRKILDRLLAGQTIALISDAGTPLINDPGYPLVSAAHEHAIRVIPVPGASAITCALSVAGLPTDRFVYEGFLPVKKTDRHQYLSALASEQRTLIFYETPHRIISALSDMVDCFGQDRVATLAKELTKHHEVIRKDTLGHLLEWITSDPKYVKGEFVIIVSGSQRQEFTDYNEADRVLSLLLKSMSVKDASAVAAEILGVNKNRLYRQALKLVNH